MKESVIARGKPADYGQEIVKRRCRLTKNQVRLNDKIVLDFGCGNGAQTIEFAGSSCKFFAVDIEYEDLQTLAQYLSAQNFRGIIPIQYNGESLPLASNSVDLAISYEVLEHVNDEAAALNEIHRVLKTNGEIVFSVPNKGWIFETHGAYLPLLPWNRVPFFSWLPYSIHRRFAKARIYRKRDIITLLQAHSFEIVKTRYIMAPMDVVKNSLLKRFLRKLIFGRDTTTCSFLSTAILVHARKV